VFFDTHECQLSATMGIFMSISTRLTQLLRIKHPILLAPMDVVSGGRLAAAVTRAGGFGMIGGGYGDESG
jgi:nitronate monooxygenase